MVTTIQLVSLTFLFLTACQAQNKTLIDKAATKRPKIVNYKGTASVSKGAATVLSENIFDCSKGRKSPIGSATATDGSIWIVPSEVNFSASNFPFASDLYNSCSGNKYNSATEAIAALDGSDIITIDSAGELITAYVFADNYFEMYINGIAVGKDNVPFTQFNSNIIRFKVNKPFTIAMKLVDWEENSGLGSERNQGYSHHPGDGGMIAVFTDNMGTILAKTDAKWKSQTFYTSPIKDLSCPTENGFLRLTADCNTNGTNDGTTFYALHWKLPTNWYELSFDDSSWPNASTYTNATVGVDNKPAYTNFTSIFDNIANDAQFIWSTNLILDNEVIVRYTVK